jgi:hypothetical protein
MRAQTAGDSHPKVPSVESIRGLSELTTLRVEIADVRLTRISGMTGGVEAAMLVRGDLTVSTDLAAARFEAVDASACTATLTLPPPRISPPRVNHERSRLVTVREFGLWTLVPGEDASVAAVNRAWLEAERQLATDQGITHVAVARRRAEQVLTTFFGGIGWRVRVRWADGDLRSEADRLAR